VGTLHCASAYVERGADDFVEPEGLGTDSRADNIYRGVDGTDLMKMNLLNVCVVDSCFGCGKRFENRDRVFLGNFADARIADDVADFTQSAARFVRMAMIALVLMWQCRVRAATSLDVLWGCHSLAQSRGDL